MVDVAILVENSEDEDDDDERGWYRFVDSPSIALSRHLSIRPSIGSIEGLSTKPPPEQAIEDSKPLSRLPGSLLFPRIPWPGSYPYALFRAPPTARLPPHTPWHPVDLLQHQQPPWTVGPVRRTARRRTSPFRTIHITRPVKPRRRGPHADASDRIEPHPAGHRR